MMRSSFLSNGKNLSGCLKCVKLQQSYQLNINIKLLIATFICIFVSDTKYSSHGTLGRNIMGALP